jgi:hypothetical protein
MKTNKFSQTITTQHNSQQRMQRMRQMELPLWKQIKILPTQMEKEDTANRKTNDLLNCVLWICICIWISHQEC